MAIAPNLTTMVGELVGARLIAHAGSLLNLAKHPSSTVQILGAEKALFRYVYVQYRIMGKPTCACVRAHVGFGMLKAWQMLTGRFCDPNHEGKLLAC